jgi:hypothetical protein
LSLQFLSVEHTIPNELDRQLLRVTPLQVKGEGLGHKRKKKVKKPEAQPIDRL